MQDFYSRLFDWEIDTNNDINYGMIKAGREGSIGGGIGSAQEGHPGHAIFYVEVADVDDSLQKVESMGGKTVIPKTVIPDMVTFAVFKDPEGHAIGLVESYD